MMPSLKRIAPCRFGRSSIASRAILSAAGALLIAGAPAIGYSPPFDVPAPRGTAAPNYSCPPTAAPVVRLFVASRYTPDGGYYDLVDPELDAAYKLAIKDVNRFLADTALHANRYMQSNGTNIAAANCSRSMLLTWARADAVSDIGGNAGWFKQSTTVAGAALTFLQIKGSGRAGTASADAEIALWLSRRADALRLYRDRTKLTGTARNNHLYWAGVAIGASGAAINDATNFNWGMNALETGVCSVNGADLLPEELKRGSLALFYHIYALKPLTILAELAERNNRPAYALCNQALVRLVKKVIWIAPMPSRINPHVPVTQRPVTQQPVMTEGEPLPIPLWAWIVPYSKRYRVWSDWDARIAATPRLAANQLGGNMVALYPD